MSKVRSNIYPPAWNAVSPADSFPWHRYAYQPHSSQALAIDVFGSLMMLPQEPREAILSDFAASQGIPDRGPWSVELEWLDERNLLNEKRQTQVDALIKGAACMICVECKFTEYAGGSCSQIQTIRRGQHVGMVQCNGNYEYQTNPVNKKRYRCTLNGKGIRY